MRWLRFLLGALVLAAAVILLAPAALLDASLASRTGERLRLADARGVWWNGHSVVASASGTARIPLAWRVDPAALARGATQRVGRRSEHEVPAERNCVEARIHGAGCGRRDA